MDARVIGERSDAVLRTAKPAHDNLLVLQLWDVLIQKPWEETERLPRQRRGRRRQLLRGALLRW
jgi:hypothetical protein